MAAIISTWQIKIFIVKRALTVEFFVKEIEGRKMESQDSYSNDDVSVISDSDTDIFGDHWKGRLCQIFGPL